jgi:hypothetical protein
MRAIYPPQPTTASKNKIGQIPTPYIQIITNPITPNISGII